MNYSNRALERHLRARRMKAMIRHDWFIVSEVFLIGLGFGFLLATFYLIASQI